MFIRKVKELILNSLARESSADQHPSYQELYKAVARAMATGMELVKIEHEDQLKAFLSINSHLG